MTAATAIGLLCILVILVILCHVIRQLQKTPPFVAMVSAATFVMTLGLSLGGMFAFRYLYPSMCP